MKKILLSLLVLLSALGNAQLNIPCTVQKSELFKDEFKNSSLVSIEQDKNGGVIMVRSYMGNLFNLNSAGYYIEHYDANMKLIKNYTYALKDNSFLGLFIKDEKVYTFNVNYEEGYEGYVYTASTADISDFNFTSPKELFRVKGKKVKYPGVTNIHKPNVGNFNGTQLILNDTKTAFIISINTNNSGSENEMSKIYVFDMALSLKIEHHFERDIKARRFFYSSIDVSKDGSAAYILGRLKTDESRKKDEGGRYEYELTRITNTDSKTVSFGTGQRYANSLKTIFKGDKIACIGFYSDMDDSRYKGLCYYEIDMENFQLKTTKFSPFTEQFMIDKYGKNKDKELKVLEFKEVYLNDKNEIIFNAEETYTVTHSNYNGSIGSGLTPASNSYSYHYDDIISAKIADNGDLVWARNINKRQEVDDLFEPISFISYTSLIKGDETYFFINASDKVKRLRNDRIEFGQTSRKNSNLNVIRINKDGDFDFKEVLNSDDNEVTFMTLNGAKAKYGNSIYFMGRSGKKKQLLKLSI